MREASADLKKKAILILLCLLFVLFSGCAPQTLLERPADGMTRALRAGSLSRILFNSASFLSPENLPGQDYVSLDLDLDGEDEIVSFLSLTRSGERRVEVAVSRVDSASLSRIGALENTCDTVSDFYPARLSENVQAMVIGWSLAGSESRGVSVCTLTDGVLDTLYGGHYSAISVADYDGDGYDEILIARAQTSSSRGSAVLLDYTGDMLQPISRVALSQGLTGFQHVQTAKIGFEQTAMICEGYIEDLGYVSDYLVYVGGRLLNVFLSDFTNVSSPTLRSFPLWSDDVDGNGYVELPVVRQVPREASSGSAYTLWFVDWMQCGDTGMASTVCTTYHDFTNEWYMLLPSGMENNLTVEIALDSPECMGVLFYYFSDEGERTVPVWEIFLTRTEDSRERLDKLGMTELDAVFPCTYFFVHYRNVYGFSYSRRSLAAGFHAFGDPVLPDKEQALFDFS